MVKRLAPLNLTKVIEGKKSVNTLLKMKIIQGLLYAL